MPYLFFSLKNQSAIGYILHKSYNAIVYKDITPPIIDNITTNTNESVNISMDIFDNVEVTAANIAYSEVENIISSEITPNQINITENIDYIIPLSISSYAILLDAVITLGHNSPYLNISNQTIENIGLPWQ